MLGKKVKWLDEDETEMTRKREEKCPRGQAGGKLNLQADLKSSPGRWEATLSEGQRAGGRRQKDCKSGSGGRNGRTRRRTCARKFCRLLVRGRARGVRKVSKNSKGS